MPHYFIELYDFRVKWTQHEIFRKADTFESAFWSTSYLDVFTTRRNARDTRVRVHAYDYIRLYTIYALSRRYLNLWIFVGAFLIREIYDKSLPLHPPFPPFDRLVGQKCIEWNHGWDVIV